MAIFEQLGRMTYIDAVGDQHILYPVTKKECVEGFSSIEDAIGDIQKLETIEKSSLVAAINEARSFSGGNIETIQQELNKALEEAKLSGDFDGRGIVSVVRTGGNGAAGTTDEYTITYTDSTTSKFNIYNGANGVGDSSSGEPGENGATFIPSINEGYLSWNNDKGLANPDSVKIIPERGIDFWTADDIADIKSHAESLAPTVSVEATNNGHTIKIGEESFTVLDGVSPTHRFYGTMLSITSASGTSSVNLKGDNGDPGVGIEKVTISQSNVDGGDNIIELTLSDKSTYSFNVKNGNSGRDGIPATINGYTVLTLNCGTGLRSYQSGGTMSISADLTSLLGSGMIILKEGLNYHYTDSEEMPAAGNKGRLFFKKKVVE